MERGTIAVLAPSVYVSVTIEAGPEDRADIHLHAGGQGIWVARMVRQLGHHPAVCAPIGGEGGQALVGLTTTWGIRLEAVTSAEATPVYVHDRRLGERREIARSPLPRLLRHEVDEFYSRTLQLSMESGMCLVTGPADPQQLPTDMYRRLGADLHAASIRVVADLHGPELEGFLEGGPIDILKVSDRDLVEDGLLDQQATGDGREALIADAADVLASRGCSTVVVSRGSLPAFIRGEDGYRLVTGPDLAVVDATGSGDSMTAALAVCAVEGTVETESVWRKAWAAGAANVTRHGLGSGAPALIEELAGRAVVDKWHRD